MASSSSAAGTGASQLNRRKLTQEANSHGPYLWSGSDIENALLWFTQSTQQQQQQQLQRRQVEEEEGNETIAEEVTADLLTENEQSSSSVAAQEEESAGCEFLRSLLHSRGIWNPRPSKLLKKKRPTTTSNTVTNNLGNDGHVHKRKRKRRRKDDSTNGRGNNIATNAEGNNNNNNDGEEGSKELSSPLQSVLLGYYQLYQTENVVTKPLEDDGNNNNNNSNDNGCIDKDKYTAAEATTISAEATLRASSKLYDDLSTIILSRQHTQDIYHASLHTTPATNLSSTTTTIHPQEHASPSSTIQRKDRNHHRLSFQMTHKIDQYMVHPTTCARRMYASSIYDRLLHLSGTTTTNNNNASNNATNNYNEQEKEELATTSFKGVQKFLQKLFGLTTSSVNNHNDRKIQEVILLLVLEPLRRFQVQQQRRQQLRLKKRNAEETMEEQGENDLMDLFPFLTSQMVALSSTSTSSSTKNKTSQDVTTNDESSSVSSSSPLTSLVIKSILHTNSETWWSSQPSPLLCTISHYHFPIAHKYIQYWFNKALVTHASCYKHEKDVEEYHGAVERLQEFYQTSCRLREYLSHVICNLEKEVVRMSSLIHDDEVEEEDESEVFKTSLALRAVKRALNM